MCTIVVLREVNLAKVLNLKITKLSFHFEGLQREGEGNFLSWMTGPWLGKESESPHLERKPEFQAKSPPKISTGANAVHILFH